MTKFGPSSIDEMFILKGKSNILKVIETISSEMGLKAFEYAFNLGINVSDQKAQEVGLQAQKFGVEISAHAPYYINLANPDPSFEEKGFDYIIRALKKLKLMGGRRLVVHLGSPGKCDRRSSLKLVADRLEKLPKLLDENGLDDALICFETMGKYSQIGSYSELAPLTKIDRRFSLTLDFGHINCTMQGGLKTEKDYQKIFDDLLKIMPREKVENIHIHFSKILYGGKGEIKHSTFDEFAEPPFEPLAKVIVKNKLSPVIICESRGMQARDAHKMKKIFEKML